MNRRHFMHFLSGSLFMTWESSDAVGYISNSHNDKNVIPHRYNKSTRFSNGYYDIDFGLEKGKVTVIGGRPSMGKSTLIQNIVQHVSITENIPIGYFSHIRKPLLIEKMIVSQKVFGASETDHAAEVVSTFNIIIDDRSQITMNELQLRIERWLVKIILSY